MSFDESPREGILVIPWDRLASETLDAIILEYVLREGTDYGEQEVSLAGKKSDVLHQLQSGSAMLLFDPIENSCHIELTHTLIQQGWRDERS
mgnify:CR=1 FL=1